MEIVWRYNEGRTVSKSGEGEEGSIPGNQCRFGGAQDSDCLVTSALLTGVHTRDGHISG